MTNLEEIEKAVSELSSDDLARFRAWFDEFLELTFDDRIEHDLRSGRLDWLEEGARLESEMNLTSPLPIVERKV